MPEKTSILIVEDHALIALGLALAVEDAGAHVIGPAATIAEALALIDGCTINAAILDADLGGEEITPVALRLIDNHVPFVVHTGTGLPAALAQTAPATRVVMKPASPNAVVAHLVCKQETFSQPPSPTSPQNRVP